MAESTPGKRSLPTLPRGALERVLARAAELQGSGGEDNEPADVLTDEQIVELGREVGLSSDAIRQALAEERARVTLADAPDSPIAKTLFGASSVAAQRVVPGSPERVLATLNGWMQREEWLRVVR